MGIHSLKHTHTKLVFVEMIAFHPNKSNFLVRIGFSLHFGINGFEIDEPLQNLKFNHIDGIIASRNIRFYCAHLKV